jgi:hypothetical protein
MSKVLSVVAVLSHSYPKGSSIVNAYVLDGTPEEHEAYRAKVSSAMKKTPSGAWIPDMDKRKVADHAYEDRQEQFPLLVGNPMFYSLEDEGDLIEIVIPEDDNQQPRIETMQRTRDISKAKKLGSSAEAVWDKHQKELSKRRVSIKSGGGKDQTDENTDDLDALEG